MLELLGVVVIVGVTGVVTAGLVWLTSRVLQREVRNITSDSFPAVTFGILLGLMILLAAAVILGAV